MVEPAGTVLWVGEPRELPSAGFQVVACENPAWILDAIERDTPDLVVVDLGLGGLRGAEVLGELHRSGMTRIVRVVVLGKDEGLDWRAELFRAGAADVIGDALDGGALVRRLRAVLEGRPWGGAALGAQGPGPAVATIAELQRTEGSAVVDVGDGKRRGAVRVEAGRITAVAVAGYVGEEALNCLAGRRGWTATLRPIGAAVAGAPVGRTYTPPPGNTFTPLPSPAVDALGAPHVLVADDDEAVRRLLDVALKRRGFRVTTAARGEEALAAARADPPDVVLSDVMMPGGDGWWLLARLRQDFRLRETPFIVFTNKGVESHVLEALGVRPTAVFRKDPQVANVVRILDGALAATRTLFVQAAARPDQPFEGSFEGGGPLILLRALLKARRHGWLKLQSAAGPTATLTLRDDLLVSATVKGPTAGQGRDAVAQVVALEWRSYRFEPAEVAGAGALGPAAGVLREACDRCGRFFERVRAHGLSPAGGAETDPDGAYAYGRAATALAAPVVRALLRRATPDEAAAATGAARDVVDAILFDMVRHGAILLAGLDAEAPAATVAPARATESALAPAAALVPSPAAALAPARAAESALAPAAALAPARAAESALAPAAAIAPAAAASPAPRGDTPDAERRAAEAERRAREAEERARAMAAKAAAFEAQARQSATIAGQRAAAAMAEAEQRIAELERRASERGEAVSEEMVPGRADYAPRDRLHNEPTLIVPMPTAPADAGSPAGAADALAHWGAEETADAPRRPRATPPVRAPRAAAGGQPSADLFGAPLRRAPTVSPPGGPASPMPAPVVLAAPLSAPAQRARVRTVALVATASVLAAGVAVAITWLAVREPERLAPAGDGATSDLAAATAGGGAALDTAAAAGGTPATASSPPTAPPDAPGVKPRAVSAKKRKASGEPDAKGSATGAAPAPGTASARMHDLVDKGTTLLLNGKIGPAIAAFRAAAAADPLAPEPYRGLVFAYVARRDRPSADAAFASYLRLRPAASDAAELRRRIADLK
ncbi:MAG TPA: response regulator [Myxococcota bacterium]|nr:response regulator [Myxococcota bacterium]